MKILVADTDSGALTALRQLLEKSGVTTTSVATGDDALAAARREDFDLFVLPLTLPDMSGIRVCQRLKAQSDHFLPGILLTDAASADESVRVLESGADDFVTPTMSPRELLARIKALLRIKALHDEVRHLAAVREQIVYTVSHDFRTPVVGIRGAIQNLTNGLVGSLTDEQREYLALVDQAAERLAQMTEEMCAAARSRNGTRVESENVDLAKITETAAAGLRPGIVDRKIRFVIDRDDDAPPALGDSGALTQVVANLLDNAVKHSPVKGRIKVEIKADGKRRRRGGQVRLSVIDQGPGIARSDFERIFFRFEQVGGAELNMTQGTGLGLAVCREIVEAHHGEIWVESERGKGATFHVRLPAAVPVRGAV